MEAKRRDLLKMQLEQNENLQAVATKNGTLNQHRHGGTPRADKEAKRREMIERVRREADAATARLGALRAGSKLPEAEEAHRRALEASARGRNTAPRRNSVSCGPAWGTRGSMGVLGDDRARGDAPRTNQRMNPCAGRDRGHWDRDRDGDRDGDMRDDWGAPRPARDPEGCTLPNGPWGTPAGPGPMGPGVTPTRSVRRLPRRTGCLVQPVRHAQPHGPVRDDGRAPRRAGAHAG